MQKKLSRLQLAILNYLNYHGDSRMSDILELMGEKTPASRSALSRSLKRLEDRGLLWRNYNITGYRGWVGLTKTGTYVPPTKPSLETGF